MMAKLAFRLKKELGNWRELLPKSWRSHFEGVDLGWEGIDPSAEIKADEKIWPQEGAGPPGTHVFKAFKDLAPEQVRVVIFGNDPYTQITQATGRSFEQGDVRSWSKDLKIHGRVSPSYLSILCAEAASVAGPGFDLESSKPVFDEPPPSDDAWNRRPFWWCHLELARGIHQKKFELPAARSIFKHWASQGVFWLNTTLTYSKWDEAHRSSHHNLWAPFTQRVLEVLTQTAASRKEPMAFALWGSTADDLEPLILDLAKRAQAPAESVKVTKTGHPQWPPGYWRAGNPLQQVNQALGDSQEAIDWA